MWPTSTSSASPSSPDWCASSPGFAVQERIGQQLADSLVRILAPHGVAVSIDAVHLCTQMRGVREIESRTRTTYWRGNYEHDPNLRMGFFHLCEAQARHGG